METIFTSFNGCMDDIYRSYMGIKYAVEGRLDKDVRNPKLILAIASELNILPKKQNTIKITGSKGKGTVSRMINHLLIENIKEKKIGLLVSPEEFDHNDRMKINDKEISKKEFVRIYNELKPILVRYENNFTDLDYLSPSGIFLLIALFWFKENNVYHYVLELGRGAAYDEVGHIPSAVSVVTSILDEHASYLGPSIEDIAINKFYVKENSDIIVLGPISTKINEQYNIITDSCVINVDDNINDMSKPHWYLIDEKIAYKAVSQYCEYNHLNCSKKMKTTVSASFGIQEINKTKIIYEPLISIDSIDETFINNLLQNNCNLTVLASLPDDKDIEKIISFFKDKQIKIKLITLSGTRGYLHYNITEKEFSDLIINDINYDDNKSMIKIIQEYISKSSTLYLLGTHTYIRLVKRSLRELGGGNL